MSRPDHASMLKAYALMRINNLHIRVKTDAAGKAIGLGRFVPDGDQHTFRFMAVKPYQRVTSALTCQKLIDFGLVDAWECHKGKRVGDRVEVTPDGLVLAIARPGQFVLSLDDNGRPTAARLLPVARNSAELRPGDLVANAGNGEVKKMESTPNQGNTDAVS